MSDDRVIHPHRLLKEHGDRLVRLHPQSVEHVHVGGIQPTGRPLVAVRFYRFSLGPFGGWSDSVHEQIVRQSGRVPN